MNHRQNHNFYSVLKLRIKNIITMLLIMHCFILASCTDSGSTTEKSVGFSIFMWNSRNKFIASEFIQDIIRVKSIGANTIFLCPYIFVSNVSSSYVFQGADTISTSDLSNAILIIKTNGLKTGLKPHIGCLDGSPRYLWNPEDYDTAKTTYTSLITNYSGIAELLNVDYFIFGTELDNIAETESFFEDIITDVRQIYSGKISYSSSYNHFPVIKFWNLCDFIGINAWLYLSDSKTPDRDQLIQSWQEWNSVLNYYSAYYNKKIFFTEIGYINMDYPAINPGDFSSKESRNDTAQANCFYAAIENFKIFENYMGMSIWNWELSMGTNINIDYTPVNKPAENVIRDLWID